MKKFFAVVSALMVMASVASANLLLNPSFETGTGQGGPLDPAPTIDNWTFWGDGWWANDYAQDGTWSIKRWSSGTGLFQDFAATESQEYQFSLYGYDNSAETLVDRALTLNVEWYTVGNVKIGPTVLLDTFSAGGPLDTWRSLSGVAAAPATTSYGRFYVESADAGGSPAGAVFFDSASVNAVPEPASMTLLGLGALVLLGIRRKMAK